MKILYGCSLLFCAVALAGDPTAPAPGWFAEGGTSGAQAAVAPIQLQLIKKTDQGWLALVNGQLLRKGQQAAGFKVLDISANQVIIEKNGQKQTLRLLNTAIKQYEE